MNWTKKEYNEWIKNGQPINLLVQELNISGNNMNSLNGIENLVNLTILDCSHNNQLTSLNGIENLINLTRLNCYFNKLTSLHGIKNLVNLTSLPCGFNRLTSLNGIENLVNLTKLYCNNNQLTSLNGIENLVNLTTLDCSSNQLTSLNGIENLVNLIRLYCSNNQLTSLNGIENLINLTELKCSDNQLTSLNGIENLVNLTKLLYKNNLINHIPPNIVRRLNRFKNGQNVYNDGQNVHNHNIQESIRKSVNNILKIKPIITDTTDLILNDTILTNETKEILMEYKNSKDIYSALNITFEELLLYVFNRIEINEHKNEIKHVLNAEMIDSLCKCFTGRMSRLINCLNGFDSLVNIGIADNEQIAQIIEVVRVSLERENKYDLELHKELVRKQLIERNYDNVVIEEWVTHIE
jgi:Leucine-rich repeat (LRR) protein